MSAVLRKASSSLGLLGALALFAAASYYVVYREVNAVLAVLVAVGVLGGALYIWASSDVVTSALTSRRTRRGSNSLVMLLAFVAIVGLLNVLAARYPVRWDLTESGEFSLSPQTVQLLNTLKSPVRVMGFYSPRTEALRQQAEDLLKEYAARSDKFTYEIVDIDQRPTVAQQYAVRAEGLLFLSGDKRQEVLGTTQSDFTNAIIKVTSAEVKKVAFVTGHGERAIDGSDSSAYSRAKAELEADNYTITAANLLTGPVPEDVSAVVLAGPRSPLSDQERQVLRDYIKRGGKLLLLYDPLVEVPLDDLLVDYGVSVGRNIVVDTANALFPDPGIPIVFEYGWSPITKDLGQTVFPGAAAIGTPTSAVDGVSVTPLARTSDKSWTTSDPRNPQFKEGDSKGPLTIAATIEATSATVENEGPTEGSGADNAEAGKTRIVVVADSDFAANAYLGLASNRDLLVNSVNWLTEDENMISIRPKPPEDRSVYLTPTQSNLIWFSSIVLLPLLVLGAGVSVWWSRR